MTADVTELLEIARQTIAKVRFCFAVTHTGTGGLNARVVEPAKVDDTWHTWFMTSRSSRKVAELEECSHLLLGYQYDPEGTCVTLHGTATINGDVAVKKSVWTEDSDRWFPGGPSDPDVVIIEFRTERIELWSSKHGVMPGFGSARLDRRGGEWIYSTTEIAGAN